jgi:hypothetical protein
MNAIDADDRQHRSKADVDSRACTPGHGILGHDFLLGQATQGNAILKTDHDQPPTVRGSRAPIADDTGKSGGAATDTQAIIRPIPLGSSFAAT